jgi:hypothetical protein
LPDYHDYPLGGEHVQVTPDAIAYIETYDLAAGVVEIVSQIRALMPHVRGLRMEVFEDPTCDCEPELRLYALFPADVAEDAVDETFDQFDEVWWLDNCARWDFRIEVHPGWR